MGNSAQKDQNFDDLVWGISWDGCVITFESWRFPREAAISSSDFLGIALQEIPMAIISPFYHGDLHKTR